MTVKVERIEGAVPHRKIMAAGMACTLLFLYLTYLNPITGTKIFSFFGGLAFVATVIWGSDAVKVLQSYGLATGHPSAGMIALGSGIIAMLFGSWWGAAAPLVALAVAGLIGVVIGYVANNVLMMKIPVMVTSLTELACIGALSLLGLSATVTGGFSWSDLTTGAAATGFSGSFIGGGLIALVFILAAFAIQHPFNASSGGPSWKQDRMLVIAAECAFLSLIIAAVLSFAFIGPVPAFISLVIAAAGWLISYSRFITLSRRDAAAWLDAKPIRETEAH
jgi:tetrahydromethanopterin S-methyltransferase subunit C